MSLSSTLRKKYRWTPLRTFPAILLAAACIVFISELCQVFKLFVARSHARSSSSSGSPEEQYSPLKEYQHLNQPAIISTDPFPTAASKRAIVSTMYTDPYAIAIATLGHSIRATNTTARLLVLYISDRISPSALCVVRAAGWIPVPVSTIPPPHGGKDIYWRFTDQYTKLHIWSLDRLSANLGGPVEQAVYIDADTLVLQNLDELFQTRFTFGAVPDIYTDERGFSITFNAGVMVFRPSTTVFENMKTQIETAKFPLLQAEQAFLNLFYGATALRLPYGYNANLALKSASPEMWKGMIKRKEMMIVHYTLAKPFEPYEKNGFYAEEVRWWREEKDRMMKQVGDQINTCGYDVPAY